MSNIFTLTFLCFTSCYQSPELGDGRLVIFHLDDNFTVAEERNYVIQGIHMWDNFGTNFVLAKDYPGSLSDGPNVLIERSSAQIPPTTGICWPGLNRITIYADYIWTLDDFDRQIVLKNVVGHEVGHLMGLPHWGDPGALMYPDVYSDSALEMSDKEVFCKYYPMVGVCNVYP